MNTHIVTKKLPVGTEVLEPGTEVDASEWKHVRLLVEQRYLKPLDGVVAGPQSVNVSESEDFYARIVAGVIQKLRDSGELQQLIQPNGREQRMGRKDKTHGTESRN